MDVILSNDPQSIETMHGSDQEEEKRVNLPERVGPGKQKSSGYNRRGSKDSQLR